MQIQINDPFSRRRPARRSQPVRQFYFQNSNQADSGIRSFATVAKPDFGVTSECNFQVSGFKVRSARIAIFGLMIAAMVPMTALPQSLWRLDASRPMCADKRATTSGDILTIVVQENTTASKDNKTATTKSSAVDASISSFLFSPGADSLLTKNGQFPAMRFDSKNDFNGGGSINNSENIIARVAVQVIDVLPNRNLVIEGKRETAFSGERQTVVLRGVVRPEDVAANNTVLSYNVYDATIQIISKGTITDNQRKGWFNRIWDKISPF